MDQSSLKEQTRRGAKSVMTYPHPSFDLSSAFIPPSMKELYRWCLYLYITHSEIKPILKKKVAYVQTPLIYTGSDYAKKVWKKLLEEHINIKRVEIEALLDVNVYGVAYLSPYYPFERFLTCPTCKKRFPLRNLDWEYRGYQWQAKCKGCGYKGIFKSETVSVRNYSRAGIIRWRPLDIEVNANPWTGHKEYVYRPPKHIVKKIEDPKRNRYLVETTPDEILMAIKEKKNFNIDRKQLFVFSEPSPSSEDDSFPIPPLLHVFKDCWLYQTLRRAQEAIAAEHILPLTVLIPSAAPGGVSPHMNYNLATWAEEMQNNIRTWRRDPNAIFTAPFPASIENIRGDAQALNTYRDQEIVRQGIAGGLDVPIEFIIGNLQWSGGNVSLRVLENLFMNMIEDLERFESVFLVPRLQAFYRLPKIDVHHQEFKMADDPQQKQIVLSLRQTNTVSDRTTRQELGFDDEDEKRQISEEREERLKIMHQDQVSQAKTQAEVQRIMGEAQVDVMRAQAEMQSEMQAKAMQAQAQQAEASVPAPPELPPPQPAAPGRNGGTLPPPELLSMMADHFLKNTPDDRKEGELMLLGRTNPALAKAVRNRVKMIQNVTKAMKPLPEQKPPRSPRAGI